MAHKFLNPLFAIMWQNLIALIRLVDYRILLMGLALVIVFWLSIWTGLIQPTKAVLEIAAVVVTALVTFGLLVRFAFARHLFLLWGAGFMALAMFREIHFSGSDEALLIGWPALLLVILWRYDIFKSYLKNPVLVNFLAVGFLFYLISQTIDQRWWRGLPGERVVHVRLEELTELLGHCTIGVALIFCKEVRLPEIAADTAH